METKTTKIKKLVTENVLSAVVVITMMATVALAAWQIPTATATSLEEIRVSRKISAPVGKCIRR